MNTNHTHTNRIFCDRSLADLEITSPRHASLYAACQEPSDALEASLRFCLVLCTLVALLICGWRTSTPQNAAPSAARTAVAVSAFGVSGRHVF